MYVFVITHHLGMCLLLCTICGCVCYYTPFVDVFVITHHLWMCLLLRTICGCVCYYTPFVLSFSYKFDKIQSRDNMSPYNVLTLFD